MKNIDEFIVSFNYKSPLIYNGYSKPYKYEEFSNVIKNILTPFDNGYHKYNPPNIVAIFKIKYHS